MKRTTVMFLIVLPIFCMHVQAKELTVCIEDKLYIPYLDSDLRKSGDGLLIQLVTQSARLNQLSITLLRQSWPRCLQQVETGEVDALMAVIYTTERAKTMVFPKGAEQAHPGIYLMQVRYPFFVKKGHDFSFADRHKKLAFGIGTPYQYVSYDMLARHNLLPVFDYDVEAGLAMVAAGRLDAYVVETLIGLNSVTKLQLQDTVVPTSQILLEGYWHIAFNRDFYAQHTQQVEGLWTKLATIRETLPEPASKNLH